MALELMVTLTETAPALARRCPGLVDGLIPFAMALMTEVEEEEADWVRGRYVDEPCDENYVVGEQAIERTAAGMGSRSVAPTILTLVQQYAGSAEWTQRRAAVAGLCRLVEGCSRDFYKNYFAEALNFLSNAITDRSPRVQFQVGDV